MSRYIQEPKTVSHKYLAWIAMFLLIFNALQGKLTIMLLRSSVVIAAVQAIAVLLLFIYLVEDKKLNPLNIQLQAIDIILILTLVVMLMTIENFSENMTYLIRYSLLILVVIVMKYDDELPNIAIKCVLIVSAIHVICTIWFYFDQSFYLSNIFPTFDTQQRAHLYEQVVNNDYATGLASHYSANGINIAIAVCAIYAFFFQKKIKGPRIFLFCGFAVFLITLFMTGKRAALFFILATLLVTYIACNRDAPRKKLIKLLLIIALFGIIIYILSLNIESIYVTIDRVLATFGLSDNPENDVSNGRFKLYSIAWSMFLQNPLFGIGWREFTNDVSVYYHNDSALRDVHNVFLQLLCETGIIGFLVFSILFVSAFAMTIYIIRMDKIKSAFPSKYSMYMAFSFCYQVYFLLYCLTGNPLYDLQTVYIYILCIGISACIYFRNKNALAATPSDNKPASKYLIS